MPTKRLSETAIMYSFLSALLLYLMENISGEGGFHNDGDSNSFNEYIERSKLAGGLKQGESSHCPLLQTTGLLSLLCCVEWRCCQHHHAAPDPWLMSPHYHWHYNALCDCTQTCMWIHMCCISHFTPQFHPKFTYLQRVSETPSAPHTSTTGGGGGCWWCRIRARIRSWSLSKRPQVTSCFHNKSPQKLIKTFGFSLHWSQAPSYNKRNKSWLHLFHLKKKK